VLSRECRCNFEAVHVSTPQNPDNVQAFFDGVAHVVAEFIVLREEIYDWLPLGPVHHVVSLVEVENEV
jgi:hypothetical protein